MTAALIASLALISVAIRLWITIEDEGGDVTAALWDLARFFTILTNLLVALTFALVAIRRTEVSPPWLAALTLSILLVGSVYHLLLSHLVTFTGWGLISDHGLHTVVPLACLIWWLHYAPKRSLTYADLPSFVLWPSIYVAYALWRGWVEARYPYPFMDLTELSRAAAATNLAGLFVLLLLGGVLFISIGRYADR